MSRLILYVRAAAITLLLGWGTTCALTGKTGPKVVRDIRVSGASAVRAEELLLWAGIRKGQIWTERSASSTVEAILRAYRDRGFWHVRVAEPTVAPFAKGVSVRIDIEEGDVVTVRSIAFDGAELSMIERLERILETEAGDALVADLLVDDADALLDFLESGGYPFAEIEPDARVAPDAAEVDVVWHIDLGPRVSIDAIRFSGNRLSKSNVLMRETGLKIGDVYDQRKIDQATQALRRLPWLVEVAAPELEIDARSGRYVVHYQVEDAKQATIEGAVGLLPGASGAYNWVGRFNFLSDNLSGSGRSAQFLWERPGLASSDLQVAYGEPWLLGRPLYGKVSLSFEQRPGYIEAGVGVGLQFRPQPGTVVGVLAARSSVRPDSVSATGIARQSAWSVSGEGAWDRRNSRRKPTRGWSARLAAGWDRVESQGTERSNAEFNRLRYEASVERYVSVTRATSIGLRLNGSGLFQAGRPSADALIRVGGSATIRGYIEEHFLADHAIWSNASLIRDLGRRARGYLFVDVGRVRTVGGGSDVWLNALGYGVGLQTQTRTGLMTVEYGLSKDDSAGEGKVHVRMVGAF